MAPSSALLSSAVKAYDPISENYLGSPFASQPLGYDFADYLPYKNLDYNCDVTQSFDPNFEAADLFLRNRRDSIDCLFENEPNNFKSTDDRKSIQSPSRPYPMHSLSKVFDEDLRFENRRLFNADTDGIAPSTFTDGFGAHYEFNEKQPINPIMRQNSILTPTAVRNLQSTSASTKKLSDSESKSDETCSQKRLCVRDQKGEDTASIAEDFSVATKTASYKKHQIDSISEEEEDEDMIYVPFDYVGDGRKREAKRHKSHTIVPRDEIDLDAQIREKQNTDPKIIALEQALEDLKTTKLTKRELQSSRNRLTAQLSRDRQKIELNFLKTQCINYQRLLRRLNKKLDDTHYFCSQCNTKLSDTLQHHQNNLFVRNDVEPKPEV